MILIKPSDSTKQRKLVLTIPIFYVNTMMISTIFWTLLLCFLIESAMMQQTSSDLNQHKSSSCRPRKLKESVTNQGNEDCGPSTKVCPNSRYRSFDGSCNNLKRPNWGAAQMPYARLTKENYGDGISTLPRSVTGRKLPNARELSFRIFRNILIVDHKWNLNAAQYGQIITHDMSLTADIPQIKGSGPTDACCDNSDGSKKPGCAPIFIPPNDPVHRYDGKRCFEFIRTGTTRDRGCTARNTPAQQITAVTAYMDMSIVYGNSKSYNARLRTGKRGKMLTLIREGQAWPPQAANATDVCAVRSDDQPCYLAGDIRVNQNTHLTLLQVVLLREHNRIADKLASLNPHWNDEILFQEARRILIAQMQHINYYEFLPILLGSKSMAQHKLIYRGAKGYVDDYNPKVNPSVINEHATASFRHFHNLIRGMLELITKKRQLAKLERLSNWLNKPQLLEMDDGMNNLVRGLTSEKMRLSDQYWSAELTTYIFRENATFGRDLRADDIQRGRDHGLGTYVEARAACNLSVPKSYDDMREYISGENIATLKDLYASVKDIDLVVGGSLEYGAPEAMAGPTFICISLQQFYRTRVGDRYFYENGADPDIAFTPRQLATIRKGANMARLLCDNANGVRHMQPKAFRQISEDNQLVSCDKLPSIDLKLWQDEKNRTGNQTNQK